MRAWMIGTAVGLLLAGRAGAANTGISVAKVTYGRNCGAYEGNYTSYLRPACDGRSRCEFPVSLQPIRDDPASGCAKDFVVQYACDDENPTRRARLEPEALGKTVVLECPVVMTMESVDRRDAQGRSVAADAAWEGLKSVCEGRARCAFDPRSVWPSARRPQGSTLAVSYRCTGDVAPRTHTLAGGDAQMSAVLDCAQRHDRNLIDVLEATAGANCPPSQANAAGNWSAPFREICSGQPACEVVLDDRLLSSPSPGCPIDLMLTYRCTQDPPTAVRRLEMGPDAWGQTARLDCGAGQPPGRSEGTPR